MNEKRLILITVACSLAVGFAAQTTQAGPRLAEECVTSVQDSPGYVVTDEQDLECGKDADARGNGTGNTAFGNKARATGPAIRTTTLDYPSFYVKEEETTRATVTRVDPETGREIVDEKVMTVMTYHWAENAAADCLAAATRLRLPSSACDQITPGAEIAANSDDQAEEIVRDALSTLSVTRTTYGTASQPSRNSRNAAFGNDADARGNDSGNVAVGGGATAFGHGEDTDGDGGSGRAANIAIGEGADARGNGSGNVAVGGGAMAFGHGEDTDGDGGSGRAANIAIGEGADARGRGTSNVAIGAGAKARGNSIAIGAGVEASAGEIAIGSSSMTEVRVGVYDLAQHSSDIAANSANIATNSAGITANSANIATNSAGITANSANIATNSANITANSAGIAQNAQAIAGFTQDLREVDTRVSQVAAMAAALSAVPNAVPDGQFFVGVGVGGAEGESAVAVGVSGRLGSQKNLHLNAGAAASGGDKSVRAGIGWSF